MTHVHIDGTSKSGDTLLRVDDVHKTFESRSRAKKVLTYAVRGVSFSISQGETVGVVGESGCGKTTLARLLAGLEEPTRGVMTFSSAPMKFTRSLRKKISVVFQDPYASLNPRMSTASILREPMHLLSDEELEARLEEMVPDWREWDDLPRSWIKRIALKCESQRRKKERILAGALLDIVQLRSEWSLRYPHEFSGGQRQRIGIARALATSPELLILDEPVSALDVSVQAGIISLLKKLAQEDDLSMLFISHDLRVVNHLCDRVIVMYLGQIMEDAPSSVLFSHPCHPYTRALLGSIPTRPDESPSVDLQKSEESTKTDDLPLVVLKGDLPSPTNPPDGCPFRTRCERAREECASQPPLAQMTDGRLVACHFPY